MLRPFGISLTFAFCIFAFTQISIADDIQDRLDDMKIKYRQSIEAATQKLDNFIAETIKSLAEEGKLDEINELSNQRERFQKTGELPTAPILKTAVDAYTADTTRSQKIMIDIYERAIKEYTKALQIDKASLIDEELKQFVAGISANVPNSSGLPQVMPTDAIGAALQQSLNVHAAEVESAKKDFADAVESKLKNAASSGDLDLVKHYQQIKERFEAKGTVWGISDTSLKRAHSKFTSKTKSSVARLENAYKKAIQAYSKKSMDDEADALRTALWKGVGLLPQKWQTIFQSADPKLWGKDNQDEFGFSIGLDRVEKDIQYLRLRRMDNGNFVIIPMTHDQLDQNFVQGSTGWSGDNLKHEVAQRFGIYRTDYKSEKRGTVVVGRKGFTPYTGWGFGSRHNVDDTQGYVWQGQEIPKTVFEISVSSQPLEDRESRFLLEPKK